MAGEALEAAAAWQRVLIQPVYSEADKKMILDLIEAKKKYFTVETDRDKVLTGKRITAKGGKEFLGRIECLIEVENRDTLDRFNSQVLKTRRYENFMLIDGNAPRGIDVALPRRLPLRNMRTLVHDRGGSRKIFSRDCPEYEITLPEGRSL
ncbi:MAG: hypothetical protein K7J46_16505 [Bryobacter sp.]|nr:hypothetical protein [Bryobacter sp. CoA8 C33]